MTSVTALAIGLDHPEGVAWHPDGHLLAGGEAGQLYRISVADQDVGEVESFATTEGFCLGIALDGDGHAFVCDMGRQEVVVADAGGEVRTYAAGTSAQPMRTPNFPVFTSSGHLFVSDSGAWGSDDGLIWVVEPGGRACAIASAEPSGFPNGLAIDPTGEFLYVVESSRANVSRLPILGATLGPRELVVELPDSVPDGIAFASDGTLLIGCYRPDRIYVYDGALHVVADDATGMQLSAPTNLCFFGPRLERLVVANLAGWHLAEVETGLRGAELPRPSGIVA